VCKTHRGNGSGRVASVVAAEQRGSGSGSSRGNASSNGIGTEQQRQGLRMRQKRTAWLIRQRKRGESTERGRSSGRVVCLTCRNGRVAMSHSEGSNSPHAKSPRCSSLHATLTTVLYALPAPTRTAA